jgi:hypothetical protein
MKTLLSIILVLVIAGGAYWLWNKRSEMTVSPSPSPSVSSTGTPGQTISDGTITVQVPVNYGLAVNQNQVPVHSYIPPCDEGFNYCVYYNGNLYQGTNFESAGVRIQKRPELNTKLACIITEPAGYSGLAPTSYNGSGYATSVFSPLSDAGAGHSASGALYRLFLANSSTCYEFETRVGQTQFANYPSGTIKQFTASNETDLQNQLKSIVTSLSLPNSQKVTFPQ